MGLPTTTIRTAARTSFPVARALVTWFGVGVMAFGFASCLAAVFTAAVSPPSPRDGAMVVAQAQR